jgi:hypothetical protein
MNKLPVYVSDSFQATMTHLTRIIHVDPDLIAVCSYGHLYERVIFTALVWWCSGDPGAFCTSVTVTCPQQAPLVVRPNCPQAYRNVLYPMLTDTSPEHGRSIHE